MRACRKRNSLRRLATCRSFDHRRSFGAQGLRGFISGPEQLVCPLYAAEPNWSASRCDLPAQPAGRAYLPMLPRAELSSRRGERHIPCRRSVPHPGDLFEIRPPDPKLLAVCIDPFPQVFSGNPSLRPGPAFDAHHIGRKPAAIAAAETATMVGSISRRLQAAYDRLTVVIAERAGYARRQPSLLRRVERVKKL